MIFLTLTLMCYLKVKFKKMGSRIIFSFCIAPQKHRYVVFLFEKQYPLVQTMRFIDYAGRMSLFNVNSIVELNEFV